MTAFMRLLSRTGFALTNPFYPQRSYHRPRRGDSRSDFSHIAGDFRKVAADLTKIADKELASNGRK